MLDQAANNYQWFRDHLSALMLTNRGQHALLRESAVVGFFQSSLEAIKAGMVRFGEGNFSVELVDDAVEDLGFYSHVDSTLHA